MILEDKISLIVVHYCLFYVFVLCFKTKLRVGHNFEPGSLTQNINLRRKSPRDPFEKETLIVEYSTRIPWIRVKMGIPDLCNC